jgi:hypothetical protein
MKPRRGRGSARRPGSTLWLQGLACGALVALATPVAALAALLMVPSLGAFLLEHPASRVAARVALLCGLAAAAAPLAALWQSGQGVSAAVAVASDTGVLSFCWAAQAAGWLLAHLAPLLTRLALEWHATALAARLRGERARYEAEWGIPPA